MAETVSLAEASERLGVHYMTAYRYVRTGRLAAEKNGGQWFVNIDDLAAVKTGRITTSSRPEVLPVRLEERLLAGDEIGSFQILEDAMAGGAEADEVYLDLLTPALAGIGQRWHDGEIDISDEHVATATAIRVVSRLGSRVGRKRGRSRGTIVLATVANDHHFLPTAILRDLLRARGFDVEDLGANTPPDSIASRCAATNDLVAIGLAATTPGAEEIMSASVSAIREQLPDMPIVVGGSAFSSAKEISGLGDCIASTSARDALETFDRLHAELRSG